MVFASNDKAVNSLAVEITEISAANEFTASSFEAKTVARY